MCGIVAVYMRRPDNRLSRLLSKATDIMSHRGPDGRGFYADDRVLLGHRRLAIVDLGEGGSQPKTSSNGMVHIVYNGEVYNYIEIRDELRKRGCVFSTQSDTEVLLEAFALEGPACLSRMNGMFGFVVWDTRTHTMYAVRDRYGVKPLYYLKSDGFVAFASEIKALLPFIDVLQPNDPIIYDYLHHNCVDHTDESFFLGIHRVPAGHYVMVTEMDFRVIPWYDLRAAVAQKVRELASGRCSARDNVERFRELFINSVRLRLRSDVPVGSCLSGGIDSSSIVCVAVSLLGDKAPGTFQTYTASYGRGFASDESRYVKLLTNHLGINANFIHPTVDDLNDLFADFIYCQEEPVTSTSPFSQYMVMRLAHSKGAKVLLDGQGADEILAGYHYFLGQFLAELLRRGRLVRFLKELAPLVRRRNVIALKALMSHLLPHSVRLAASARPHQLLDRSFVKRNVGRRAVEKFLLDPRGLNNSLVNHILFRIQHLLRWEDRNSMAFSIETRVPFMDYQLLAYTLALPPEYKIRGGITKWVLRESLRDMVPARILGRTDKIGFATPERYWASHHDFRLLKDLRDSPHPMLARYVDMKRLSSVLSGDVSQMSTRTWQLVFRIMCLDCWFKLFFPAGPGGVILPPCDRPLRHTGARRV
ncbi:MAG: asparagine synthase (glutamine-hydrolyzing) [Candidatus Thorarchaeota archaeon]